MRLAAVAAVVLGALASTSPGAAATSSCPQRFTQLDHVRYVHAVYRRPMISTAARRRMARMQRCAYSSAASANMAEVQRLAGRSRARRQAVAKITPYPGPGGPWAIPWPIVKCESDGRNLPPNSATAAGFYQFITSTWHMMGGPTARADLASRQTQDRIAARLWDGGRGAGHWVCAHLVGWTG